MPALFPFNLLPVCKFLVQNTTKLILKGSVLLDDPGRDQALQKMFYCTIKGMSQNNFQLICSGTSI